MHRRAFNLCGGCSVSGCAAWLCCVHFTCGLCDQAVCRAHFRPEDHQCPHQAQDEAKVLLCPCCDTVVRASPDENPNLVLAMHMDSQECQRDVSPATCARRQGHREVVGTLVCFPWSVHKLLGHSNEKAQKRLEAMSTGPYGIRDLKAVLEGTGLKFGRSCRIRSCQKVFCQGAMSSGKKATWLACIFEKIIVLKCTTIVVPMALDVSPLRATTAHGR